jgi:hypothetical protein
MKHAHLFFLISFLFVWKIMKMWEVLRLLEHHAVPHAGVNFNCLFFLNTILCRYTCACCDLNKVPHMLHIAARWRWVVSFISWQAIFVDKAPGHKMLNGFCRVDVDVTDACARNQSLVLHSIACHFTDWMTPVHSLLFKDSQHWLIVEVTWTARNTWDIFHALSITGQKYLEKCPDSFLHWISGVCLE